MAIINYNLRTQSKEELAYAKELAHKYKKEIFIYEIRFNYFWNKFIRTIINTIYNRVHITRMVTNFTIINKLIICITK